jgi:F0F1-type ATP synthase assembly protein I
MAEKPQQKGSDQGGLAQAMKYAHLGMVLPVAVFVGWLVGAWADKMFETSWITLAGILLGIVAGFVEITRAAMKMMDEK